MNIKRISVLVILLLSGFMLISAKAEQTKPLLTLKQAMDLDKHDKPDQAVAAIQRIIEQDTKQDKSQAYLSLGLVYFRNEEYSNALLGFLKSVEIKKDNPMSYYFMGLIYEKKALGTSKSDVAKDMKIKALESWQNYLKYIQGKKIMPAEAHKNIGITVKESIKRAKNHVEILTEGLQ